MTGMVIGNTNALNAFGNESNAVDTVAVLADSVT